MPLSLLTVLSALAAVYFSWSLIDPISLATLESIVLRAMRRTRRRHPYVVQHRFRDTVGFIVAVLILSLSLYGETFAHRPQAAARPKESPPPQVSTHDDESTQLHLQDSLELQDTLDKADLEIQSRLKSDRP